MPWSLVFGVLGLVLVLLVVLSRVVHALGQIAAQQRQTADLLWQVAQQAQQSAVEDPQPAATDQTAWQAAKRRRALELGLHVCECGNLDFPADGR
jgi:hypothetical protein